MTVKVAIHYVDGSYSEHDEELGILARHDRLVHAGKGGKALIDELLSDDWAAPPRKVTLSFRGDTGMQTIELYYS